MTRTSHVMVFPCGSEIGLELHRSLSMSPHLRLFGASSAADHGSLVYRDGVWDLPMIGAPSFLDAFNAALDWYAIDYVFPAHDEVLVRLAEWAEKGAIASNVIAPSAEVAAVCRSKSATYKRFAGILRVPRQYSLEELDASSFPVFIKPDAGQGSRGAMKADDMLAAAEKMRISPDSIILEYLPGREYTVDCFTNRHGSLLYVAGRERRRIANGIAVNSIEVENPLFHAMASRINHELKMWGPWFFQIREADDGVPKLLEIAPRIAGTSGLARARGVNLPLLAFYDRLGLDVDILRNKFRHVEIDRALSNRYRLSLEYDTVYVDLDETVILRGQVNTKMVAFLYQCRNHGKKLVLVTRHIRQPEETLRIFRLETLFDTILWLRDGEKKSSVMTETNALFIDDSFYERNEVSQATGIPVFEPAAIEALLES